MEILFIIGMIFAIKELYKEKTEKRLPGNYLSDMDKFRKDVISGVPSEERMRRIKKGYYKKS